MARTKDLNKRVVKLKGGLDMLVECFYLELKKAKDGNAKLKMSQLDIESLDDVTLMQIQQEISQVLLSRARGKSE